MSYMHSITFPKTSNTQEGGHNNDDATETDSNFLIYSNSIHVILRETDREKSLNNYLNVIY